MVDKTNENLFYEEIRGIKYAFDIKTEEIFMGDKIYRPNDEDYTKYCYLVLSIIDNKRFREMFRSFGQLIENETKVGKKVLKEKYGKAYQKLLDECIEQTKEWLSWEMNRQDSYYKVWMQEFFASKEFETLKNNLTEAVNKTIAKRDIESLPYLLEESELMKRLYQESFLFGNMIVNCKEKEFLSNIVWCARNCPNYNNCPIWSKMKEEDDFSYKFNLHWLKDHKDDYIYDK